jgi:hypothetical protein
VPTHTSSPIDNYNALVSSTLAGAAGTGRFTYSLDNGETALKSAGNTSAEIVSPASGGYAIPDTGLVLTFTGSFVLGDTYTFKTAAAEAASGDLTTALTAMETTYLSQATMAMETVIDMANSAAAWATQAAALETHALALFSLGIYVRAFTEVPTLGSVTSNPAGTVDVDTEDTDSVLVSQRALVSAVHVVGCAGDALVTSSLTGLTLRRNAAWLAAARASAKEASQNLGAVADGGLTGVVYLFRDETSTPVLDAAGFLSLRTFPGAPGFFCTDAHTCSLSTSDYYALANARVVDRACGIARVSALPLVQAKIPTKAGGVITEGKAKEIEGRIDSQLETNLVDTSPADAVGASVTVSRTNNVLSTGEIIMGVSVQPFAYARTITQNIGLSVQA